MLPSENTPETSENSSEDVTPTEMSDELSLAEMLAGPEERSEGKGEAAETPAKPLETLQDAAERLGIEMEELYKLQFRASGDGESQSLGEMKDLLASSKSLETDRLAHEEEVRTRRAEWLKVEQELSILMSELPESVLRPEVLQSLAQKRQVQQDNVAARIPAAIPEWKDSQRRETELAAMREHLRTNGVELLLDQALARDVKTVAYLRDNWMRYQRVSEALAKIQRTKTPSVEASKRQDARPRRPERAQGGPKRGGRIALEDELAGLIRG